MKHNYTEMKMQSCDNECKSSLCKSLTTPSNFSISDDVQYNVTCVMSCVDSELCIWDELCVICTIQCDMCETIYGQCTLWQQWTLFHCGLKVWYGRILSFFISRESAPNSLIPEHVYNCQNQCLGETVEKLKMLRK